MFRRTILGFWPVETCSSEKWTCLSRLEKSRRLLFFLKKKIKKRKGKKVASNKKKLIEQNATAKYSSWLFPNPYKVMIINIFHREKNLFPFLYSFMLNTRSTLKIN